MTLDQLIEKLQKIRNNTSHPIPNKGDEKVAYQEFLGDNPVEITHVFVEKSFNEDNDAISVIILS